MFNLYSLGNDYIIISSLFDKDLEVMKDLFYFFGNKVCVKGLKWSVQSVASFYFILQWCCV